MSLLQIVCPNDIALGMGKQVHSVEIGALVTVFEKSATEPKIY